MKYKARIIIQLLKEEQYTTAVIKIQGEMSTRTKNELLVLEIEKLRMVLEFIYVSNQSNLFTINFRFKANDAKPSAARNQNHAYFDANARTKTISCVAESNARFWDLAPYHIEANAKFQQN